MIKNALENFVHHLIITGFSEHTLVAYQCDLNLFISFLEKRGKNAILDVLQQDIIEFLQEQTSSSSSTLHRRAASLKSFFRFLEKEKMIAKNPCALIESPKLWQCVPEALTHEEMEKLLSLADVTREEGARDRAIMEVLYGTGTRVSELCSLNINDIENDALRVRGKRRKERLVPIGREALDSIDHYLGQFRDQHLLVEKEALFVNSNGRRIDRQYVWKMLQIYGQRAQIQKRCSPHTLRHTYASHLLKGGADLRVIQELLGHENIATTDRYTHMATDELKEAFHFFHPRK